MSGTGPLPPGWDMKFDSRTGKYYFINHYTKTTSWEDPREKYQQIGKPVSKDSKENYRPAPPAHAGNDTNESEKRDHISLQEYRQRAGSPGGGAGKATPTPHSYLHSYIGATASPQPLARLQLEEAGISFESPMSQRSTLRRDSNLLVEMSDLDNSNTNTEQIGLENEPGVHLSRYLKSVFPTVEEYLLLDVLANSENNVQKATDRLVKMGYVKRETPSAPRLHAKKKEEERLAEKRTPLPKPPPIKTDAEKEILRNKMKDKYETKYDIPERILFMALESVLYDEDQANNLITAMIEDDLKRQKQKEAEKAKERAEKKKSPKPVRKLVEAERTQKSPKHEPKKPQGGRKGAQKYGKDGLPRISQGTSMEEEEMAQYTQTTSLANGPNPALRKGPNDDLLLTDYVIWNGPEAGLRKGSNKDLVRGPNPANCKGPKGSSLGPNSANRKGPQVSVKGSIIANYGEDAMRSC